jgi:hypothetical protein
MTISPLGTKRCSGIPSAAGEHDHRRPPAKDLDVISRTRLATDLGEGAPELFDSSI